MRGASCWVRGASCWVRKAFEMPTCWYPNAKIVVLGVKTKVSPQHRQFALQCNIDYNVRGMLDIISSGRSRKKNAAY